MLNPKAHKFLPVARKSFPNTDLRLVTNGLLVPTMNRATVESIRNNEVTVDVSNYPPTSEKKDEIKAFFEANGITYNFKTNRVVTTFFKPFALRLDNADFSYECPSAGFCVNLRNGKLAKCPMLMHVNTLNAHFGMHFPTEGLIDIYENEITGDEILVRLGKKVALCEQCVNVRAPWEAYGKSVPQISDWVVDADSAQ